MNIILVNCNSIHRRVEKRMGERYAAIHCISDKAHLTPAAVKTIQPDYIFFLHWSWLIPEEIYEHYTCIVFHMTDLPYGRGGSPLQNLIVRGHEQTQMSAIRVEAGLDTGDVYLKRPLSLLGTAEEIFMRAGQVMEEMMDEIIRNRLQPEPQAGEPVVFKRRKPEEGNIAGLEELKQLYDHIRMLDAEGYPKAFLETGHFRLEFTRTSLKANELVADVRIIKK